jgi:hypothetical protein
VVIKLNPLVYKHSAGQCLSLLPPSAGNWAPSRLDALAGVRQAWLKSRSRSSGVSVDSVLDMFARMAVR